MESNYGEQVEKALKQVNIEQIKKLKESDKDITNIINELKGNLEFLKDKQLLEKRELNTSSRWSKILDNSYYINYDMIQTYKDDVVKIIFETYEKIVELLTKLQLIHSVKNVITFVDEDSQGNYNYMRLDDVQYHPDFFYLNKTSSEKGNKYGLRFKEGAFKEQKEKIKQQKGYEAINKHFQFFIKPYIWYENHNKTGWKINKGVMAQAFERHWENAGHNTSDILNNPQALSEYDIESRGRRWWMYRQSSGSDPFFTGPDTIYSQVKSGNASLVSNIDTVINALTGILVICSEELDNEIKFKENINQQLATFFQQKNFSYTLNQKLVEGAKNKAIFGDLTKGLSGIENITFTVHK